MKSRIVLLIITIILMVVGCFFLIKRNEAFRTEKDQAENIVGNKVEGINIEDLKPIEDEDNIQYDIVKEKISSNEKVFLYFYTTWCPTCKTIEPMIEEIIEDNPDIVIIKIDADVDKELKNEYKVYNYPTIVLIEKGTEIERIVEIKDKEKIVEFISK